MNKILLSHVVDITPENSIKDMNVCRITLFQDLIGDQLADNFGETVDIHMDVPSMIDTIYRFASMLQDIDPVSAEIVELVQSRFSMGDEEE